ncbi:MAG: DUF429 domain-containing protein [Candidatus Aenigmatarchaeota archaeon]
MFFVGVDLAWSENNPSGFAVIEGDNKGGELVSLDLLVTDDEIKESIEKNVAGEDAIVAVDAPLLVPNETGRRPAEEFVGKLFRKYDAGAHPANRRRFVEWTGRVRGEDIVEELESIGFNHDPRIEKGKTCRKVVEVYPHPSMVVLFELDKILQYKNKPGRDYGDLWEEFRRYQKKLEALENRSPSLKLPEEIVGKEVESVKGKELKNYEDKLDAIFCAYIAHYCWVKPEMCAVLGNTEEGYILTPVKEEMREKVEELKSQKKLNSF